MNTQTAEPEAFIPAFRNPTEYEKAVLNGLQSKQTYAGFGPDIIHLAPLRRGRAGRGRLAGYSQPDPRIAQVDRRRAKNRVARKSRRANR